MVDHMRRLYQLAALFFSPILLCGTFTPGVSLLKASATLNNGQILGMSASPVTIVPAPGPGYAIQIFSCALYHPAWTAYTSTAAASIGWATTSIVSACSNTNNSSAFSGSAEYGVIWSPQRASFVPGNVPIQVGSPGTTLAGGAASNLFYVTIWYTVEKIP
jgi:hypothetical protein